jgi:hypothetical protein
MTVAKLTGAASRGNNREAGRPLWLGLGLYGAWKWLWEGMVKIGVD